MSLEASLEAKSSAARDPLLALPQSSFGPSLFPALFAGYGVLKMKKLFLSMLVVLAACPGLLRAEDFLGAPVIPGGRTTTQAESRLEQRFDIPVAEAVEFYEKALKDEKDIKFRERRNEIYIEDQGSRPWHSITIKKTEGGRTSVVIVKDNWTWIIGSVVLRFVGVFVVLGILYIALSISGAVIPRLVEAQAKAKAKKTCQPAPTRRQCPEV